MRKMRRTDEIDGRSKKLNEMSEDKNFIEKESICWKEEEEDH